MKIKLRLILQLGLNGRKFELTVGTGDGQGGLVCCSPLDTTEGLN